MTNIPISRRKNSLIMNSECLKIKEELNLMLNFKKGLAMVLAAVTALTFAPTVNFGTTVDAAAAPAPAVATPSGTVTDVNGFKNANGEYDVYVAAGKTYDIVTGNTKVNDQKTADNNYQWYALASGSGTATDFNVSDTRDGIEAISNHVGKGLTITAAGQADDDVTGTTVYLKAVAKDAAITASGSDVITVHVHVYKNTGKLQINDPQISVAKDATEDVGSDINLAESGNLYVLNKGNIVSDDIASKFHFGQAYFSQKNDVSINVVGPYTSNSKWNVTGNTIGVYNETLNVGYVYNGSFEFASTSVVVNVQSDSNLIKVKDAYGNEISYTGTAVTDVEKAGISLAKGQTFDLGALTAAYNGDVKVNDATFTYESNSAAVTVDKDGKGILTGVEKASGAIVTIKGKVGSRSLGSVKVNVTVNALAADEITVKDDAGITYSNVPQYVTLDNTPYDITKGSYTNLDTYFEKVVRGKDSKIVYVTLDKDNNKSITLSATSANSNSMPAPVIANTKIASGSGSTVVPSGLAGGKITLTAKNAGYAVIKFTSQDSAKALGGTTYVFVRVLAHPEAALYGLQDSYELAYGKYVDYTSGERKENSYRLNLAEKLDTNGDGYSYTILPKSEYPNDDPSAIKLGSSSVYNPTLGRYETYPTGVVYAYKPGITAHIKVTAVGDGTHTSNGESKIIEIKTVEPKKNNLTVSVVSGSAIGATLTISSVTNLTVSADYLDKGISVGTDNANIDGAVLATTDYINTVTLYPNKKGNAKITVYAAGDGETIAPAQKQIIVTYGTTAKPSKVTGVKVTNKKGAKVTVKFNKVTTYSTMKYYVQKKIGSKVSGKSVGSTKTTLSVKKGATVKVRVKAYYYDENGNKHVGAYSAWKTLKTDKK